MPDLTRKSKIHLRTEEGLTGTLRTNYLYVEQMINDGWIPNRIDHLIQNMRNSGNIFQPEPGRKPSEIPQTDINPLKTDPRPRENRLALRGIDIDRIQGIVNEITNYLSRIILRYGKPRDGTSLTNRYRRTRKALQHLLNRHLKYWKRVAEDYGPQWCKPWIYGWSMSNYAQIMNMITGQKTREKRGGVFLTANWWRVAKDRVIRNLNLTLYS